MVDCFIVCYGETLSAKWEEVSDDWTMFSMPLSLGNTAFCGDDFEELAPEGKARNGWDVAKLRNVEWVNV